MRWASYRSAAGIERAGLLVGDGEEVAVHGIREGATLLDVIRADGLAEAGRSALATPAEVCRLADVTLLAPIPQPPSIRDFMSFEAHVVTSMAAIGQTVDPVWYEQPAFYFTNPAAVYPTGADVPRAPGSTMWDYEVEVAAVIGRAGSDLDPRSAEEHLAGYTILCDWSARDLQGVEMRVGLGPAKGKDTATSIGPVLVTPDELAERRAGNGYDLGMRARVNGTAYSTGTWADLHWTFGEMLAFASRGTRLAPGDVVGSGTVGTGCILELSRVHGSAAYPWLVPGDLVEVDVDALGTLSGRVVDGPPVVPLRSPRERQAPGDALRMRGAGAIDTLPPDEGLAAPR